MTTECGKYLREILQISFNRLTSESYHHVRCFDVICDPEEVDMTSVNNYRGCRLTTQSHEEVLYREASHFCLCCKTSKLPVENRMVLTELDNTIVADMPRGPSSSNTKVGYRCPIRSGAAGGGTALQVGRSRVRFPMGSLGFIIDLTL